MLSSRFQANNEQNMEGFHSKKQPNVIFRKSKNPKITEQ